MIRTKFRISDRDSGDRNSGGRNNGAVRGPATWNLRAGDINVRPTLAWLRTARGAIEGDYKRTTMRMAQLYGPLKARRCVTSSARAVAAAWCERVPTLRGSFLSRPPSFMLTARLPRRNKHRCLLISRARHVGFARFRSRCSGYCTALTQY